MTDAPPRPRVVTPAGEVFTWGTLPRHANHQNLMNCGACGTGLRTVAMVTLAMTYRQCDCGTPEYPHLVEQLWHRGCLPQSGPPERAQVLLEAAKAVEQRSVMFRAQAGDQIRRKAYRDIGQWLRKMARAQAAEAPAKEANRG